MKYINPWIAIILVPVSEVYVIFLFFAMITVMARNFYVFSSIFNDFSCVQMFLVYGKTTWYQWCIPFNDNLYSIQYFTPAKAKTWPFSLAPSNNPMHNLVTFPISFLIRLYSVWFWLTDRKEGEKYIFYYFLFVFISFFVSHLTKDSSL